MIVKIIKNKIYVVDGMINYPIIINKNNIKCQCHKSFNSKNTNSNDLCIHIKNFLNFSGLDDNLLVHWIRIHDFGSNE